MLQLHVWCTPENQDLSDALARIFRNNDIFATRRTCLSSNLILRSSCRKRGLTRLSPELLGRPGLEQRECSVIVD